MGEGSKSFGTSCDWKRLAASASHWIARYEIWTLNKEPRRTIDVRIQLKKDDVWRQYCHSLHDTIPHNNLKLQFPVSISPCIRKIAILQNVYSITIDEAQGTAAVFKDAIPVPLDKFLAQHWSIHEPGLSLPLDSPDDTRRSFNAFRVLNHFLTYSLTFGPDGNSIFFIGRSWATQHFHVASFDLEQPLTHSDQYKTIASMPDTPNTFPEFRQVVLHPSCSLAAFSLYDTVYLWAYKASKDDSPASVVLCPSGLDNADPECKLWCCENSVNEVKSLAFSKDGNHLVVGYMMDKHPSIYPIPEHVFAVCGIQPVPDQLPDSLTKSPPSESLSAFRLSSTFSGSLIKSAAYAVGPSGEGAGLDATIANGNVVLSLWHREKESVSTAEVEIIALPSNWVTTNHSNTSIQLPKTKEENIRIILNKAGKPFYDMGEAVDNHLPAVIDRNPGSVRIKHGGGVITDRRIKMLLGSDGPLQLNRGGEDFDNSDSETRDTKRRKVQ